MNNNRGVVKFHFNTIVPYAMSDWLKLFGFYGRVNAVQITFQKDLEYKGIVHFNTAENAQNCLKLFKVKNPSPNLQIYADGFDENVSED